MELRVWSIALVTLGLGAAVSGCRSSNSSFECSSAEDCGADGRCEATGFCSFPDPGCASGFRYSDFAESLSNQCVVEDDGSTGLATGPASASTSTSSTASTSTEETATDSSGSSDSSTSASTSTTSGTTGPTGSSSESGSETTGTATHCLLEEFDAAPGLPLWFSFSDGVPLPSVEGGQLLLEVQSPEGPSTAGLRTNIPADFSLGSARAILTEVPSLSVATTAFSLNDEVFGSMDGRTFGVVDGMVRIQQTVDGVGTLLASDPIDEDALPLEFAFVLGADGAELSFVVMRGDGTQEELYTEPAPDWLDDAYVSLDVGNPSSSPTLGITRFDLVELCADGLK